MPLRSARRGFSQTTLPLISPRRGRRILRREQLFAVVRESLIRGGVLSTSYEFKVLTLDANGDGFLVLIDLALPATSMPDEYLLEIERWIQSSARARHGMEVAPPGRTRSARHCPEGSGECPAPCRRPGRQSDGHPGPASQQPRAHAARGGRRG